MPADVSFKYKDLGMARIQRDLVALNRGRALVGWPGNGPKHKEVAHVTGKDGNTRAKKSKKDSPVDVATIAVIHEFGSPKNNIPSRPLMRQTAQVYGRTALPVVAKKLYRNVLAGTTSPAQAFRQLGVFWEGRLKRMFREGVFKPLKPATIARKGSSRPLIDSGQLRNSITSRTEGV